MPNFGQQGGAMGAFQMRGNIDDLLERKRQFEREQMNFQGLPDSVMEASDLNTVFIYNVGLWAWPVELASHGTRVIPALDEALVLNGEHHVSSPMLVEGVPFEPYPAEGGARVLYEKAPPNTIGPDGKKVKDGVNFAREILGLGRQVNPTAKLTNWGCFISTKRLGPKPIEPFELVNSDGKADGRKDAAQREKRAKYEAELRDYNEGLKLIIAAEDALRKQCNEDCTHANTEHTFKRLTPTEKLFQEARLIGKTPLDCPWLTTTSEELNNVPCIECARQIAAIALRCGFCGQQQVSDERLGVEREKRRAARM